MDIERPEQTEGDRAGERPGNGAVTQRMAERVRSVMRASDTVSRLADNEIGVLASDMTSPSDADVVRERISQAIASIEPQLEPESGGVPGEPETPPAGGGEYVRVEVHIVTEDNLDRLAELCRRGGV